MHVFTIPDMGAIVVLIAFNKFCIKIGDLEWKTA